MVPMARRVRGSDSGAAPQMAASDAPPSVSNLAPEPRPVMLALRNVTKSFVRHKSLWHRLLFWFGVPVQTAEVISVVDSVSFEVRRGECVGLIGQNGAGKSTLLKLITRTMRPTSGRVEAAQSVSAILELGLGFNPEFTGRENIRHSGGMLGFSPERVEALLPSIEDFAEIGEYFDRPLRTYSSGMSARLAFALATAERPDVLIVDEVLSVGDAYFQHKSFARIRSFRESGSTILLVTHGLGDVRELCDRAILMDKGRVLRDGAPDEVVDFYNALVTEKESAMLTVEQRRDKQGWSVTRFGDYRAMVKDVALFAGDTRNRIATARSGQKVRAEITVEAVDQLPKLVLGLMIRDRTGHVVWGTNTWHTKQIVIHVQPGEQVVFSYEFDCKLGPGSYSISTALVSSGTHLDDNFEWTDNFFVFDVINTDNDFFIGTSLLEGRFDIKRGSSE